MLREKREMMRFAKQVADKAIAALINKLEDDLARKISYSCCEQAGPIIDNARGYKVEVYPDGTCDLIHESEYDGAPSHVAKERKDTAGTEVYTNIRRRQVGGYIKARRMQLGMTLREFCMEYDLDSAKLSEIERGITAPDFDMSETLIWCLKLKTPEDKSYFLKRCEYARDEETWEAAVRIKQQPVKTATYTLWLECHNCHHKWEETIPFGKEFFPALMVHVYGGGLTEYPWQACYGERGPEGVRNDKETVPVSCPNCGSYKLDRKRGES